VIKISSLSHLTEKSNDVLFFLTVSLNFIIYTVCGCFCFIENVQSIFLNFGNISKFFIEILSDSDKHNFIGLI